MNVVKQAVQGYTQGAPAQKIAENEAVLQTVSLKPLIPRLRNMNLSLEEYAALGLCIASHPEVNYVLEKLFELQPDSVTRAICTGVHGRVMLGKLEDSVMLKMLSNSYLPLITSELQYVSSKNMVVWLVMNDSVSQESFMRQLGNVICESTVQQVNDCYLFREASSRT